MMRGLKEHERNCGDDQENLRDIPDDEGTGTSPMMKEAGSRRVEPNSVQMGDGPSQGDREPCGPRK